MTAGGVEGGSTVATILFATDFSPASERAAPYVSALAKRYSSTVLLTHVVNPLAAFRAPDSGISLDLFLRSAESRLKTAKEEFVSSGIDTRTILSESIDPAKELLRIGKESRAGLITIGTRGQEGLKLFMLGSTAEMLIHEADCPVLTVGPNAGHTSEQLKFDPVVCATDFSPEAAKAFSFILPLADGRGSHVYLCHVLPNLDQTRGADSMKLTREFNVSLNKLIPDAAREWCEPECIVDHGNAADGISLLAQRVKAGLIVLGTRHGSDWFRNIKAGIAFEVIRKAACPVLTVRE